MEPLFSYTCLQLKAISLFVSSMHIGDYGHRGSEAQYRICKPCMSRKSAGRIYGRGWREGPYRQEHSFVTPPTEISIIGHVFGRAKGLRVVLRNAVENVVYVGNVEENEIFYSGAILCVSEEFLTETDVNISPAAIPSTELSIDYRAFASGI